MLMTLLANWPMVGKCSPLSWKLNSQRWTQPLTVGWSVSGWIATDKWLGSITVESSLPSGIPGKRCNNSLIPWWFDPKVLSHLNRPNLLSKQYLKPPASWASPSCTHILDQSLVDIFSMIWAMVTNDVSILSDQCKLYSWYLNVASILKQLGTFQ